MTTEKRSFLVEYDMITRRRCVYRVEAGSVDEAAEADLAHAELVEGAEPMDVDECDLRLVTDGATGEVHEY